MRTEIFLSEKKNVGQLKGVMNPGAFTVMMNRDLLIWTKNGLTKKILNG